MTMIERVARAIDPLCFKSWKSSYEYEMHQSGDAEEAKALADWCMGKRIKEARDLARAAIEAMLDAEPEMIRALKPGMDYEEAYTSMIKAALEEK